MLLNVVLHGYSEERKSNNVVGNYIRHWFSIYYWRKKGKLKMVQSINQKVDLQTDAIFYAGAPQSGNIIIGETGFEFINQQKQRSSIQLVWSDIELVTASVSFKKKISRYTIQTRNNLLYSFSSKNSNEVLRAIRVYIDAKQLVKAKSLFDVFKIHRKS